MEYCQIVGPPTSFMQFLSHSYFSAYPPTHYLSLPTSLGEKKRTRKENGKQEETDMAGKYMAWHLLSSSE